MAAPLPSWPNLRTGSSGKNVFALQFLLMFKNFSAPANGTFDAQKIGRASCRERV